MENGPPEGARRVHNGGWQAAGLFWAPCGPKLGARSGPSGAAWGAPRIHSVGPGLPQERKVDVRITGGVPGVSGEGSGELLWALVSVTRRGKEQSIKKR